MNFKLIFVSCWLCQVCLFHILYDKLVVFSPRIRAKKRTQSNKKIKRPRITYYCVFGQLLFLFQFAECAFFIIVVVRSMPFDLFRVCFLSPFCELIYYGCVWLTEWDTVFGLAITILTNNMVQWNSRFFSFLGAVDAFVANMWTTDHYEMMKTRKLCTAHHKFHILVVVLWCFAWFLHLINSNRFNKNEIYEF